MTVIGLACATYLEMLPEVRARDGSVQTMGWRKSN